MWPLSTLHKKFQQVAMDAQLLKEVALKDIDEYVYKEVENVLARSRKLKKLIIKQNVLNPDQLIKVAFETSKDLISLDILGCISVDLAQAINKHGQQVEFLAHL